MERETPTGNTTPTSTSSIRRPERKQGRGACVKCHDSKVRCDAHIRGFPCSNCINSKRPDCRLHEKKKRPAQRDAGDYVPIRRRLPPQSTTLQSTVAGENAIAKSDHGEAASSGDAESGNQHLVQFVDQKDIRPQSIQRGVRIIYIGQSISNVNFLVAQRENGDRPGVYHYPSDEVVRPTMLDGTIQMPRDALVLPERELSDELIEAYFTHINPGYPIVDEQHFMRQYHSKTPSETPPILLLQAVLLVGAHVSRGRPDRDELKATFFRRAKTLYDARLEKNRDVIVQAALLLTWHSDGVEDIGANSWFWVGIAARTATGLGMHRDGGRSSLANQDMKSWSRIWWILVQFDVAVSLSYGRPQAINLDECDQQPLSRSDLERCGPNIQVDYVIERTKLCIIMSKISRESFGLRVSREDRLTASRSGDEALAKWYVSLPLHLQLCSSERTLWSASLHLTYNNFLILLHRPHPKDAKSPQPGANDSNICSAGANTIGSIFQELYEKDHIKYLWISDINALFTAMVQISVEFRLANPVLAINALRRFESALSSLKQLADYWIHAQSILQMFEENSQIQNGIRLGKGIDGHSSDEGKSKEAFLSLDPPSVTQEIDMTRNGRNDLDLLAAAAHAASVPSQLTQSDGVNTNSYDDLLAQSNSAPGDFVMGSEMLPVDSEWRDIYWQDPGISEWFPYFPDAVWGYP